MCFGDGTGDELTGDAMTQRAEDLAVFFSKEHIKPYLGFYFDKGFSRTTRTSSTRAASCSSAGRWRGSLTSAKSTRCRKARSWVEPSQHPHRVPEERRERRTEHRPGGDRRPSRDPYLLGSLLKGEVVALLVGDVLLAELSFLIVGFYMWFQTGSLWISMFGMAEITISLPLGYWVYTYIFTIEYFDPICMLAVYIVMAIGADDVFIWFDAYKQSAYESPDISGSLETRFIWAWRKAASAMLVTSLTTCAVFFATATSPCSIKSFGISPRS